MALSAISNSGNIVIDSLLGYWHLVAKREGIDFLVNVSIPMKMSFKGADICLILGNLLENAVEAAEKVRENKYIKIKMKYDKSNLLIFLINSYQGQLIKMKDKSLKSTKSDVGNHGVGLPSVYRAVAKYHGIHAVPTVNLYLLLKYIAIVCTVTEHIKHDPKLLRCTPPA